MPTRDTTRRINIAIPTGLHIRLKAAAALAQKTLKEVVIEACEAWEKDHD